jgi:NADPH2:quinone reductase
VHAAAGGVGLLLVQWLKSVGAIVIGTVSSETKAEIVRAAGADHVVYYSSENVAARVRELTGGEGVRVVFDGVGKATFEASIDSLSQRGLFVSYGNASGTVGPVDFGILARKGSLFTTKPALFDYYTKRQERADGAARVFEMMRTGVIASNIRHRYPLCEASQAHADLEGRKTSGSVVLLP